MCFIDLTSSQNVFFISQVQTCFLSGDSWHHHIQSHHVRSYKPGTLAEIHHTKLNVSLIAFLSNLFISYCLYLVCNVVCLVTLSLSFHLQWPYGDICGIAPVGKGQGTEFNLTFRKGSGKKSETLKFSTEHRTELLTEALVRVSPY